MTEITRTEQIEQKSKGSASYTGRKSAAIQIEAVGNNRSFSRTSRALAQDNRMMAVAEGRLI